MSTFVTNKQGNDLIKAAMSDQLEEYMEREGISQEDANRVFKDFSAAIAVSVKNPDDTSVIDQPL